MAPRSLSKPIASLLIIFALGLLNSEHALARPQPVDRRALDSTQTDTVTQQLSNGADSTSDQIIKPFIITLKADVSNSEYAQQLKMTFESNPTYLGCTVGYVYGSDVINGFSAKLNRAGEKRLSQDPLIRVIATDSRLTVTPVSSSDPSPSDSKVLEARSGGDKNQIRNESTAPGSKSTTFRSKNMKNASDTTQTNAPWGLQRISQRNTFPNDRKYNASDNTFSYSYAHPEGLGTFVYILDTGARATHVDFEGRVKLVAQFGGFPMEDDNGHGTHCAGTVAGAISGVAKQTRVRAVKVMGADGDGLASDVIAGIEYVMQQYRASNFVPSVLSLSLGGEKSNEIDTAVQAAVDLGIHFVAAAGNDDKDACKYSPSSSPGAIAVGGSDINDKRVHKSNWGKCVAIYAPGKDIRSTWHTGDDEFEMLTGTSMAAPHVAGLIAYHLSQKNRTTTEMREFLLSTATLNHIRQDQSYDSRTTPNRLLYNNYLPGSK